MAGYTCPKCCATHDGSRMPPRNPWNLNYRFRCQTCAAMLGFSAWKRVWFSLPFLCLLWAAFAYVALSGFPLRKAVFNVVVLATLLAVLIVNRFVPLTTVLKSDE